MLCVNYISVKSEKNKESKMRKNSDDYRDADSKYFELLSHCQQHLCSAFLLGEKSNPSFYLSCCKTGFMLLAASSTHDGLPSPHESHSSCLAAHVESFEKLYHGSSVCSAILFPTAVGELEGSSSMCF